jgi:glutathione S-transferase
MTNKLKIFGVPMSQAVRTVLWMMLYKKLPFELIITAPGSPKENGTRHPSYLEKYPNGTIPGLEDPETGYLLSESIAIMCYLCNKHKWTICTQKILSREEKSIITFTIITEVLKRRLPVILHQF